MNCPKLLSIKDRAQKILEILRIETKSMTPPMSTLIKELYGKDPFFILISCLLSLRARDPQTLLVCKKLFARARTIQELLGITREDLEAIIRPIGFYHKKAQVLQVVCKELLERFNGKVPNTEQDLLSLSGVGPKTAALVLGEGFGIPAICVDTHVHRVSNRLGIIKTKTVKETEKALELIIPRENWIELNRLLVTWGQNICVPLSPFCSRCALFPVCDRVEVKRHR